MIFDCFHDLTVRHGLVVSLFLAGLLGGVTHCALMCGPFVLAQTKDITKLSGLLLVPYHLGRMTTYILMAVAFHGMLNLAYLFLPVRAFVVVPLLLLAGVIFLGHAFPVFWRVFPWASGLYVGLPYRFLEPVAGRLMPYSGVAGRYILGVLLGFVPCGLVVSAVMATSSASDIGGAALSMGAFAWGTIPALVVVALGGRSLLCRFPRAMGRIRQGALVMSGLWLFALAGFFVF